MSVNDYILSPSKLALLEAYQERRDQWNVKNRYNGRTKNSAVNCKQCGIKLQLGDRVIAKSRTGNSKRYHYECAKILKVIE
jgi:hypothetical protein